MAARLLSVSSSDWPASERKLRSFRMSDTVRSAISIDLSGLLLIATATLFGERLDPPLYATATLPEFPLGLLLGASLLCHPLVLGAELLPASLPLLLTPLRSPPPRSEVQREQHDYDNNHHYDHNQGRSAHVSSSWFACVALSPTGEIHVTAAPPDPG